MEYINPKEMRALDINSAYFGVGFRMLMENAGRAVADEVLKIDGIKDKDIRIICGNGNNGGDGFETAMHLEKNGVSPKVYNVGKKGGLKTDEAKNALANLEDVGGWVRGVADTDDIDYGTDIIIDALLGTGIVGEPMEPFKRIIDRINASAAFKVSIDVPSGFGTRTWVASDLVIALHMAKDGTERFKTVVKDIGIPKKASEYVGPGDLILSLGRKPDSHKGENGRVMIVAGSKDYYGAPILTGLGALYSGADLVTLFVPESILDSVRSHQPDFIVRGYEGEYLNSKAVDGILDFSSSQDALVIGPGLGVASPIKKSLNSILTKIKIPVVIDADGLKQVETNVLKQVNGVITPHIAEFQILTGENPLPSMSEREKIISGWAKKLSISILLKSPVDILASSDGRIKLNETGNLGMTKGGTGDILAGLVGGFQSQGMDNFKAASAAAFVNGAAGDAIYRFKGFNYSASDVAREIPYTIKRFFDLYI
jgi:NAD(P)H-hydrate epimerase